MVLGDGDISPKGAGLIDIIPGNIKLPNPGGIIDVLDMVVLSPGSGGKDDIELAILLSDVTLQLSAPDSDFTELFIDFIVPSSSPFSFSRLKFLLSAIVSRFFKILVSD